MQPRSDSRTASKRQPRTSDHSTSNQSTRPPMTNSTNSESNGDPQSQIQANQVGSSSATTRSANSQPVPSRLGNGRPRRTNNSSTNSRSTRSTRNNRNSNNSQPDNPNSNPGQTTTTTRRRRTNHTSLPQETVFFRVYPSPVSPRALPTSVVPPVRFAPTVHVLTTYPNDTRNPPLTSTSNSNISANQHWSTRRVLNESTRPNSTLRRRRRRQNLRRMRRARPNNTTPDTRRNLSDNDVEFLYDNQPLDYSRLIPASNVPYSLIDSFPPNANDPAETSDAGNSDSSQFPLSSDNSSERELRILLNNEDINHITDEESFDAFWNNSTRVSDENTPVLGITSDSNTSDNIITNSTARFTPRTSNSTRNRTNDINYQFGGPVPQEPPQEPADVYFVTRAEPPPPNGHFPQDENDIFIYRSDDPTNPDRFQPYQMPQALRREVFDTFSFYPEILQRLVEQSNQFRRTNANHSNNGHMPSYIFEDRLPDEIIRSRARQIVAAMNVTTFRESRNRFRDVSCGICLETYVPNSLVLEVYPCKHLFHKDCVVRWLENDLTCPYCRTTVMEPPIVL